MGFWLRVVAFMRVPSGESSECGIEGLRAGRGLVARRRPAGEHVGDGTSMCGGWDVAGRAPRPAREDLGVEVHLRAADGRAASERAGRRSALSHLSG